MRFAVSAFYRRKTLPTHQGPLCRAAQFPSVMFEVEVSGTLESQREADPIESSSLLAVVLPGSMEGNMKLSVNANVFGALSSLDASGVTEQGWDVS